MFISCTTQTTRPPATFLPPSPCPCSMNIGYDFVAKCTSAGVRVHGMLYHLRNMDWDMDILRRITVLLRFVKGGRLVHQGITWVGFVGTYTQMSCQGYSVSLNCK